MAIINEYPEEFNIIPIPRNSKIPIFKWEEYQEKKYPRNKLYANNDNGNFAVICGKTSNNLLVLDLDLKSLVHYNKLFKEMRTELQDLIKTRIVKTPHGYHLYYYMNGFSVDRQKNSNAGYNKNFKFTGATQTNFSEWLKGFDILGNNGYAITWNSRVDNLDYKIINNEEIRHLTEQEYNTILKFFLLEKPLKVRKPFLDILNGEIEIESYATTTGKEEFVYWKYLFREVYHFAGLEPNEIYEGLAHNQPSFDVNKTEQQLQYDYHDFHDKPMTNEMLKEYFPDHTIKTKPKKKETEDSEPNSDRLTLKEETDLIAQEILREHDIITLNDTRQIMVREGIFYTFQNDQIIELIKTRINNLSTGTYKTIKVNALEIIQDSTLIDRNDFSYDGNIIVFKNGVLDFETDNFYQKDELGKLKFFYEIPYNYEPDTKYKCPNYKKALREWLGNPFSKFRVRDIFEIIGYCLTMNTSLKKAFISYGDTNSGKTQNTNIISELFHIKNKANLTLQRICKNEFGTHGLQFKIMNICDDLPEKKLLHVGTFKDLTGSGLAIGSEIKGGKAYSFHSVVKFWFNANQIPAIESKNDRAFFERFILIPFPNQFSSDNGLIPDFYKQITANEQEMKGIIYESIKGLKRLLKRKGFRPELLKNTKHIWNYESDPLYRFLYDYCKRDKGGRIETEEFHERFNDFSEVGDTKTKLTIELQKWNIKKKRAQVDPFDPENKERKHYYYGIEWKPGVFDDYLEELQEEEEEW